MMNFKHLLISDMSKGLKIMFLIDGLLLVLDQ